MTDSNRAGRTSAAQTMRLALDAVRLCWAAAGRLLAWSTALQVAGSAALLVQLLAVRALLHSLLTSPRGEIVSAMAPALTLLVLSLAVSSAASGGRSATQQLLAERVSRYAFDQVLTVSAGLDLSHFEDPTFFDRLHRATINATVRPIQLCTALLTLISGGVGVLSVGLALLNVAPVLLVFAVAGAIPTWVMSTRTSRALYRFSREQTERDRERTALQLLLSMRPPAQEIRAYGLGRPYLALWNTRYSERLAELLILTRRRTVRAIGAALVGALIIGAGVAVLLVLVQHGTIGLAAAGTGALALLLLANQLQALSAGAAALYESALFVQDFHAFAQPGEHHSAFAGTDPAGELDVVRVDALSYRYPSSDHVALDAVDLHIRAGEVVALVGENGSGKSTLAKVLAGLYAPGSGTVSWNGVDYRGLDIDQLRGHIAPMFQEFTHFPVSVRDYIAGGHTGPEVDFAHVAAAARRAGAAGMIDALPHTWDTRLGPEFGLGTELSGGQWQRLALARAIFRGASLMILDEPTAALDPLAEAELFGQARNLFPGRSIVLISHRFGTVRTADRIYVLHEGRIVESGSHDELIVLGGRYHEMFQAQRTSLLGLGAGDELIDTSR